MSLSPPDDRYHAIFSTTNVGIAFSEVDGRLIEANAAFARMLGYEPHELVGVSFFDLTHPDDRQAERERVGAAVLQTDHTHRISQYEKRYVHRDGHAVWARVDPWLIDDAATGRLIGIGVIEDITERKRVEHELREREQHVRLAMEGAGVAAFEVDLETGRISHGPELAHLLGLPPDWRATNSTDLVSVARSEDRDRLEHAFADALRDRGALAVEWRPVSGDHTLRWMSTAGRCFPAEGHIPPRLAGVVIDVTQRRIADTEHAALERKMQDTQKLESLGVLAGGIAHDFNNLLTTILGNANLARDDVPGDTPPAACLDQIESASRRAAELCKQMLAYAGEGRLEIAPIQVAALIRDTTELLRLSMSKSAELSFDIAPDLPPVLADPTQMRQVLMNLVINASEALPASGGLIDIAAESRWLPAAELSGMLLGADLPEGEYIRLAVSDTGSGMDAATRARMFDPFFTTKFAGRGLGLAAVLGIVRSHRGALNVESAPGRGTQFTIFLPQAPGRSPGGPGVSREEAPALRGTGEALVADDEEPVRTVSARILQSLGFEVAAAHDGVEAVELLRANPGRFRVVLLDLTMPRMDGARALREIRLLAPELPIVLMSGYSEQELRHRFSGEERIEFLQKPFTRGDVTQTIRTILDGSALRRPSPSA
jgi:PAS domain S-box-containing protein